MRSFRTAIIGFLPKFLINIYLRLRYPKRPLYEFGKPTNIQYLPTTDVWGGVPAWLQWYEHKFTSVYAKRDDNVRVDGHYGVLAAIIATQPSPPVVFDFGGGNGIGYFNLQFQRSLVKEWHVFDRIIDSSRTGQEQIDRTGQEQIDIEVVEFHDSKLFFEKELPYKIPSPDIIYSNTTLQYIDCLDGFASALRILQPNIIILSRFLATSNGVPSLSVPQYRIGDCWRACTFHSVEALEENLSPDFQLVQNSPIAGEDFFQSVEKGFPTSSISRYSRFLVFRNTTRSS